MQNQKNRKKAVRIGTWSLLFSSIAVARFRSAGRLSTSRRILAGCVAVVAIVRAEMAVTVAIFDFGQPRRRRRRNSRTFFTARYQLHPGDGVGHIGEILWIQFARMLIRLLLLLLLAIKTSRKLNLIRLALIEFEINPFYFWQDPRAGKLPFYSCEDDDRVVGLVVVVEAEALSSAQ